MTEDDDITSVWVSVEAQLPDGWTLDSLRCASAGLEPEHRSADWVAVATGPQGKVSDARTGDPVTALRKLAGQLRDIEAVPGEK